MKKKLLTLSSPVGLLIYGFYAVINRFFVTISDSAAYPMMFSSIILILIGIAYHGYCFRKFHH